MFLLRKSFKVVYFKQYHCFYKNASLKQQIIHIKQETNIYYRYFAFWLSLHLTKRQHQILHEFDTKLTESKITYLTSYKTEGGAGGRECLPTRTIFLDVLSAMRLKQNTKTIFNNWGYTGRNGRDPSLTAE